MNYTFSERMAPLTGTATRDILKLLSEHPDVISFAGGMPATDCLPIGEIQSVASKLLGSPKAKDILQYGGTQGFASTRAAILKYLEKSGLYGFEPNDALILSGGQQGIDLMCKCFLNEGGVMLAENPTYLAAIQIAASYKGKVVGVKSDEQGLDIADLEEKIKQYKPGFLYIVPTFSNPTGKTYSVENRKKIAEVTAKYNLMVLEDDPYGRLRFSGQPVPAVKSFDKAGNIVYISSFSKVISPGLRIGVAVGSKEAIRKLEVGKQGADVHTSQLSQAIVEEFINSGLLEDSIAKSIPLYRKKRDCMVEAIKKYMPEEFKFGIPDGGLFIWGGFDMPIDTGAILKEAISHKVAYVQGSVFFADGKTANYLRLNFSNATEEKINEGIKSLGALLKETIKKSK